MQRTVSEGRDGLMRVLCCINICSILLGYISEDDILAKTCVDEYCCKKGTLFPKLNIANKFRGLPLELLAFGSFLAKAKPTGQYFNMSL